MASFRLSTLDWLCFALLFVGALNWGLVGIAQLDVVRAVLDPVFQPGAAEVVARVIYVLVGLAGVYFVYPVSRLFRLHRREV